MRNKEIKNTTWQEVLVEQGINEKDAKSLIGFVSWNRDEPSPFIGKDITDILKESQGRVIVQDVGSRRHNDSGLLFINKEIDAETANEMFDTIMEYEQEKVYKF